MAKNFKTKENSKDELQNQKGSYAGAKSQDSGSRKSRGVSNSRQNNKSSRSSKPRRGQSGSSPALAASLIQAVTAANLPYGYWAGYPFDDYAISKGAKISSRFTSIPGIVTLAVSPHCGVSTTSTSAINTSAANFFANYTADNGRTPNYNPSDIGIVMVAESQLYAFYVWACRIYRIVMSANAENYYLPRYLCEALSIDYESVRTQLSDFAFWLETYRMKLQRCYIPNNIPYVYTFGNMFKDVYVDSPSTNKAGIYMYKPAYFLKYTNTDYSTGAALVPVEYAKYPDGPLTLQGIEELGDTLMNAMLWDQDMMNIMADIRRVYGADAVLSPEPLTLGSTLELISDLSVLTTIHNSTTIVGTPSTISLPIGEAGNAVSVDRRSIVQDAQGRIFHQPGWEEMSKYDIVALTGSTVFDMPVAEPTALDNLLASRLTTIVPNHKYSSSNPNLGGYTLNSGGTAGSVILESCGSCIIEDTKVWAIDSKSDKLVSFGVDTATTPSQDIWQSAAATLDKFNMHPLIYCFTDLSEQALGSAVQFSVFEYRGFLGDVDNYTTIHYHELAKMHTTYMLAQFDVPFLASR